MASKSSSFSPFVVAFGDEDFYLDRDLDRARRGKRSVLRLSAEKLTDAELVNLCEAYSEAPRTIIIDDAQKLKGEEELSKFIENRDVSNRSLILVAIVRDKKLPDVWELAASKGKKVERRKLKLWETDKYISFIKTEASRLRVVINRDVALMLLQYASTDLYRLENELRKLSIYVGSAGTIQKEHITLITSPTPKAEPFQVAEQVLAKNLKKALSSFAVLYRNMGDECLIPMVRALMRQVERTLVIRNLQDKGVGEMDIAVSVGMKEWPYKSIAAPIARKHSPKSLLNNMKQLCRLDADVKSSARSKRTMVELAILSIAQSS
jgi:DNA polymerase III delta subunit